MADSVTLQVSGSRGRAEQQMKQMTAPYLARGYVVTSSNWQEQGGISGCALVLILVILFVTILGILLIPFLFLRQKKGTLYVTLTKFD
jgi:hypothetical protein